MSKGLFSVVRRFSMGSAPSSSRSTSVKTIQIDQDSDKYDRPSSSKSKKYMARSRELDCLEAELAKYRERLAEAEEKAASSEAEAKDLEKQMSELESTNVDLTERIQALEDRIETLHAQQAQSNINDCSETLKVKDQYISKLEKQTKAVQDEIDKLRVNYKKKLRNAHAKLTESKQSSTLQLFELKDEISKMSEENTRLMERLGRAQSAPSAGHGKSRSNNFDSDQEEDIEDSRTKIILELSKQVSDQDSKIHELERKLVEKDKTIQELQATIKSHTESGCIFQTKQESNVHLSQNNSLFDDGMSDMSELKEIAKELKKLKIKKKKEVHVLEHDDRQSSSTSRDSGFINEREGHVKKSDRVEKGAKRSTKNRPSSGASLTSLLSENDSEQSHELDKYQITEKTNTRTGSSKSRTSYNSNFDDDFDFDSCEATDITPTKKSDHGNPRPPSGRSSSKRTKKSLHKSMHKGSDMTSLHSLEHKVGVERMHTGTAQVY